MFPLKADNPPGRAPVATLALIVVTVVVFLLEGGLGGTSERVLVHFGLIPHELWHDGVHCALNGLGDHVVCSDKAAYFGDRQPITSLTLALAASTLLTFMHIPPDWQVAANGAILITVLAARALIGRTER